jgi:hypothetical protein
MHVNKHHQQQEQKLGGSTMMTHIFQWILAAAAPSKKLQK